MKVEPTGIRDMKLWGKRGAKEDQQVGWGSDLEAPWKQEFMFRHAKFGMPIRHPSGDDKEAAQRKSLATSGWRYRLENPQLCQAEF